MPILGTVWSSNKQKIKIGDVGPGGGIVFYDAGSTKSWGRYIEIVSRNVSTPVRNWGTASYGVLASTSSALGSGYTNTILLSTLFPATDTAQYFCRNFSQNGYTDWFLPSIGDLQQLTNIQNKIKINQSSYGYLSSSEYDINNVYYLSNDFSTTFFQKRLCSIYCSNLPCSIFLI
jgi:hypothetical protein